MEGTQNVHETHYKGKLINVIGDEDTCVGFLLGGIGEMNKNTRRNNFLVVTKSTTTSEVEDCFKRFVRSPDVSIILISQHVAQSIRQLIDSHQAPTPVVLEIPTKDHPYDPSTDIILERAEHLFNPEA